MRFTPKLQTGAIDVKLVKVFTDILKTLASVLDCNTYPTTLVWNPPFDLAVPTAGNMPRTTSPDIVRVARAVDPANPTAPVHFGATSWTWLGNGSVRITDVDGLVSGVKYNLVFEVVG